MQSEAKRKRKLKRRFYEFKKNLYNKAQFILNIKPIVITIKKRK